jgi:hypothetical protein
VWDFIRNISRQYFRSSPICRSAFAVAEKPFRCRPCEANRCIAVEASEWGDRCFWLVACRHEQGTALNHPSQPHGWALMHDFPSAGPGVRIGDNTRPSGCGRASLFGSRAPGTDMGAQRDSRAMSAAARGESEIIHREAVIQFSPGCNQFPRKRCRGETRMAFWTIQRARLSERGCRPLNRGQP